MEPQERRASANDSEESLHDIESGNSSPAGSPHGSPRLSPTGSHAAGVGNRPPVQKRRRVTRACDECRRKKIKCDGKQPCTHCTVYSYECTYDQPSNRRRNATPQYVEALEAQLKRADALIKLLLPGADLNDPSLELKIRSGSLQTQLTQQTPASLGGNDPNLDTHLESMVKSAGALELDEQGNIEYHGYSSGLHFVQKMRESLGEAVSPDSRGPFLPPRPTPHFVDSPRSAYDTPHGSEGPAHDLPPRNLALELCDCAINDAGALMRFVHWPSFIKQFDAMYDKPQEQWGNDENTFLPLFYTTLALGSLFSKREGGDLDKKGYENAITEGFKYIKLARQLMDIADCRNLQHLQAIVFMIIFLQSSAKLSTCYAYVGIALRSALRMGLHRSLPDGFNPVIVETRKRVFWIIRKMDTYVGALLGLPHSINEDDIDQEYPIEVDDEYITETGIHPQPKGRLCIMTAVNAHNELVKIVGKIVRNVYPLSGSKMTVNGKVTKSYTVSYSKIVEIERDLQEWQDKLPMGLRPSGEGSQVIVRTQYLLRMAYAHAQMMLYRPFLHYVSQNCKTQQVDKRSFACAAACVSVSRNIVHIAIEMQKRKLLVGAYWFTMYTTFFAILSLVFYAVENPENNASQDVLRVAKEGKETLKTLARRSMAADRCSSTLNELFEHLPERMKRNQAHNAMTNKKRAAGGLTHPSTAANGAPQSESSSPKKQSEPPRRAQTYPTPPNASDRNDHFQAARAMRGSVPNYNPPSLRAQESHPFGEAMMTNGFTAAFSDRGDDVGSLGGLPVGDLSALMFPSADPFEYPAQKLPATQGFDQLFGDVGLDGSYQGQRLSNAQATPEMGVNAFMPMDHAYMFDAAHSSNGLAGQDPSDQYQGPLPMYMMPGAQSSQTSLSNFTAGPVFGTPPSSSPIPAQRNRGVSNSFGRVPDVNIGQLLGDNEWAGSVDPSGFGGMGAMFSSSGSAVSQPRKAGPQHSKLSYATSALNDDPYAVNDFTPDREQTRWNTF